jgi:hypothetical protein
MNAQAFIERHQDLEDKAMAMQEAAQQLNKVRCVSPFCPTITVFLIWNLQTVPHLLQRAQWAENVSAELIP